MFRTIARTLTIGSFSLPLMLGLIVTVIIIFKIPANSPDFFISELLYFYPALFIVCWIAWKKPAPGGILVLIAGWLLVINAQPDWAAFYSITYYIFCGLFITGGIANIIWSIMTIVNRMKK